jgi:hypothetical protein
MKKLTYILITVFALGVLISCEEKLAEPVLDMSGAVAPSMTAPAAGSEFVLLEENADTTLTTFTWAEAQYNGPALESTKYSLEMDTVGGDFSGAVELVNTTETSYSVTVGAMNTALLGMGLVAGDTTAVQFRLVCYVNTDTDYTNLMSGVTNYSFVPYSGEVSVPVLWVPGDYQGWNPGEAPNVFDYDGDGVYNGYIYFPEGGTFEFKFTSHPDWDNTNYGAGATPGTLDTDAGAGNLSVPGPGGWWLEIDVNNLTWGITNTDGVAENWGVIGQWLDWAEDIDLVFDPIEQHLSVTVEGIPAQEDQRFKFRANDGWDLNLGANDPDDGFLTPGGADIPIPDGGTITFILDFTTEVPSYDWYEN